MTQHGIAKNYRTVRTAASCAVAALVKPGMDAGDNRIKAAIPGSMGDKEVNGVWQPGGQVESGILRPGASPDQGVG